MASIVRSLFPSKRRKTEDSLAPTIIQTTTTILTPSFLPSTSAVLASPTNNSRLYTQNNHSSPSTRVHGGTRPPTAPRTRYERRFSRETSSTSASVPTPTSNLCTKAGHVLMAGEIRMVLVEAESRVLYDSATVIPIARCTSTSTNGTTAKMISSCKNFQLLKRQRDTTIISQMLFGAVSTTAGNDSFKIHTLNDDEQMMVSRVFCVPKTSHSRKDSNGDSMASSDSESQYNNYNTLRSLDGLYVLAKGARSTTATPESFNRVRHISINLGDDDDDFLAPSSGMSQCGSATLPRAFSPPHRLSRNRRRQMAHKTSLCETTTVPSGWKSRSRLSSCGSQTDEESVRRLALGVLFRSSEKQFMFQHMPLIEAEICRLESRITMASTHRDTFLLHVNKAWEELAETICQLHNAPRLRRPVWLSLNERTNDERNIAAQFCNQLAKLVRLHDQKNTKYFVSNLISTVLMHHMSWVASVASPPVRPELRASTSERSLFIGTTLNEDASSVGYNAQLAQYLELAGSTGQHRTAKVVICGDDDDLLSTLCSVLSYFVRCSSIQHKDDERCWQLPTEHAFSPTAATATPDSAASPPSSVNMAFSPDKISDDEHILNNIISPSCSLDSLPSVTSHNVQVCVVATGTTTTISATTTTTTTSEELVNCNAATITVINRLALKCCDGDSDDGNVGDELWSPSTSSTSARPFDGLGRSLFVGPVPYYNPHFVVSAVLRNVVNMNETFVKMVDEVRSSDSASHRATFAPFSSSQSSASVCDVQMPENVLIVADTDDWTVKVVSSEGLDDVPSPSEAIVSMLEQFTDLHRVGFAPHFLVSFLEDSLADVLGKSLSLVEIVCREPTGEDGCPAQLELSPERVRKIVGCDHSDLRLIVNVASVYWPPVMSSVFG